MILRQETPYTAEEITASLHPLVKQWFFSRFKDYSPPQYYSIINIHQRKNTIISSPTGSGKTLSAFLAIINDLVMRSVSGTLEERTYALYVSPLKALGNDIRRNLLEPLKEIEELATKEKYGKLGIRIGIRTGDTTPSQKAQMLKKPPHIIITTPESLSIMLTTIKFKQHLTLLDWLIVDEIHALAESKRGTHLSLSMERLERLRKGYCRIALSATVSPLEKVAQFLVGMKDTPRQLNDEGEEIITEKDYRDCFIVDVQALKKMDLQVISPVKNIIREEYDVVNKALYKKMDSLIQEHTTTLVFTNTRSATERVVHHLKERFPNNYEVITDGEETDISEVQEQVRNSGARIAAHHSSLSKEHRLLVEEQLKAGQLKVVVSSTSLELGIDIGSIDLVILLGSPKSVARALQRIGRSGHKLHEKSKGRIIVEDRDDLVECSVLVKAAKEGNIDRINIPTNALDVLGQHLLGMVLEGEATRYDLYTIVRQSYAYQLLRREDFDSLISYLLGEYVSLEDRYVYAKVWEDEQTGILRKKGKLTRLIYMTNTGTIPDETNIRVKIGTALIGMISEPFLEKLKKGDVFVLGGYTYEFRFTQGLTAQVKSAAGRRPTVPSWHSEMLPLSFDLACQIQQFRTYMDNYFSSGESRKKILSFIDDYLYVDSAAATSIYDYFLEQHKYAEIPGRKKLLIEHYDDTKNKYIIFHSLYGRRTNDVLSRIIAYVIGRIQHKDVEMIINDNGFAIRTNGSIQAVRALRAIRSDEIEKLAEQAIEKTEVLARRFRHCATRSLMILRNYKGKNKSVGRQQMSSRLLLSSVKQIDKDFVILKEARREVLRDFMDLTGAQQVVREIENGSIMLKEINTSIPTPFSFNLILSGYSDILKMQERQEFLRKMHEMVLAKISLQKETPQEILTQAHQNPSKGFDYGDYWKEKENEQANTEEEIKEKTLHQRIGELKHACYRTGLDTYIVYDLERIVKKYVLEEEEKLRFREETLKFLEELLEGTIPKLWTDELVTLFTKALPEVKWNVKH